MKVDNRRYVDELPCLIKEEEPDEVIPEAAEPPKEKKQFKPPQLPKPEIDRTSVKNAAGVAVRFLIPVILFTVVFAFIELYTIYQTKDYMGTESNYAEAKAVVTYVESYSKAIPKGAGGSEYETHYSIDYTYSYNKKNYTGTIDSETSMTVGSEFTILVNPASPESIMMKLEGSDRSSLYTIPVIVFVVWLVVMGFITYSYFSNKKKEAQSNERNH